jgi:hypothetical protein
MAAETATIVNNGTVGFNPVGNKVNQVKSIFVSAPATIDAADTIALTLADYGATTFLGVIGWKHTTDDSVCVTENPTTAVSSGVLTLTVPAGTDNDPRYYEIFYS